MAILYRELDDPAAVAEKLAVMPTDGRLPVRVFRTRGKISTLRWTPDGKALQYKLRVFYEGMPPTFGKSRPTEESQSSFSSGRIFDFTWSADSKQLLLKRGDVNGDVVLVSNSLQLLGSRLISVLASSWRTGLVRSCGMAGQTDLPRRHRAVGE